MIHDELLQLHLEEQIYPDLARWQVNMTQDGCCGFTRRCSSIPFGGLRFCSSLWPPMTSSSCWTRLPQVGSSFRWSQETSGGPSMVPSSPPDSGKGDWVTKRLKRDRRCDREAEWQTLMHTSCWLHFMWVQTCYDCYCILPTNIAGDICSCNIMDEISTRVVKSPSISFCISLP